MKSLCAALEASSPVDTRNYRDGWTFTTTYEGGNLVYIIYNQNRPDLTILLEYGWVMVNGEYVPGKPHIAKTLDEELDKIIEELVSKI